MAKRTDTKIAVLVQVMADLGFDQETIAKVTGVPLRTINDIANRRGYWAHTAEFNELRESSISSRLLDAGFGDGSDILNGVWKSTLQVS